MGPTCRMLALSALLLLQAACGSGGGAEPAAPSHALATFSAQPQSATVTVGAAATFAVAAQCADPIAYQWFKGAAPIPGATAAAYTTPATVKADSGTAFHATATTVAGTVASASATLTVADPPGNPPVFTLHPQSQTASAGNWVLLSVAAASETPVTYSWYQGTALQQKGSSTTLDTRPLTLAENGMVYTVVATNASGSTTSNPATLTVVPGGVATVSVNPYRATLQAGTGKVFSAFINGVDDTRVAWSLQEPGGGTLAPQEGSPYVSYRAPGSGESYPTGTFHLVAASVADPTRTFTATITVTMPTTLPVVAVHPAPRIGRIGASVVFRAGLAPAPATQAVGYQWLRNGAPCGPFQPVDGEATSVDLYYPVREDDDQARFACEFRAVVGGALRSVATAEAVLTATAADPDLTVGKVILGQGPQREDNSLGLIEDRAAVAATWVLSNQHTLGFATATVRAYDAGGNLVFTSTEEGQARAGMDPGTEDPTYICLTRIPAAYLRKGHTYTVEAKPALASADASPGNNLWPAGAAPGSAAHAYAPVWQAAAVKPLKVKLVPVQTSAGAPAVQLEVDRALIGNHLPAAELAVDLAPVWPSPIQDIYDAAWLDTLFTALTAKRLAEAPATYYYGVLAATPGGFSGLSYLGNPADTLFRDAIGTDANATLPHELGHCLGFGHANCGNPKGVDARLYPDGSTHTHFVAILGTQGDRYRGPATTHDLMSYCFPQGASDLFWNILIAARAASPTPAGADPEDPAPGAAPRPPERQEVLLLLGSAQGGTYTLHPALRVKSFPTVPPALAADDPDGLTVEVLSPEGAVLLRAPLRLGTPSGPGASARPFAANLPAPQGPLGAILLRDARGAVVARLEDGAPGAAPDLAPEAGGRRLLSSRGNGLTLLQDPGTFEVLAVLLGAHRQAEVAPRPGRPLALLTSSGLTTRVTAVAEQP